MISAIKIYTLSSLLAKYHVPVMPKLLDYLSRLIFACWFPHSIKAGKGVVLGYGGLSVVVHGDAVIGNGSVIGANAIVLKDIPPGSVAVGIPARVIQSNIDSKQKLYGSAAK